MMKIFILVLAMISLNTSAIAGNNGLMGALIGAGVGAGVGHAVDRTGGSGKGAIIGAIGGYVIGNQMDKRNQDANQTAPPPERRGSTMRDSGNRGSDCANADQYVDRAAKSSDNDDRIYYLEKAVKLCPYQARGHNDLGVAYFQRNHRHDKERARSEFNEALNIDPGYTVARNNLNNL